MRREFSKCPAPFSEQQSWKAPVGKAPGAGELT